MISYTINQTQLKEVVSLIGNNLLQIFTQNTGINLSSPPELISGGCFCLYFQENMNSYYLLTIAFDKPLYLIDKNDSLNLKLQEVVKPKIDFEKYKCSITLPNIFTIKNIKFIHNILEGENKPALCYIFSILIESEKGDLLAISQEDSPNSFNIKYNDKIFIQNLLENAYEITEIIADNR